MRQQYQKTGWNKRLLPLAMAITLLVLVTVIFSSAVAQDPAGAGSAEAGVAQAADPEMHTLEFSEEPPELTPEQIAQREEALANTHLAPPFTREQPPAPVASAPVADTATAAAEQRTRSGEPLAPGDATIYTSIGFRYQIPGASISNIVEGSVSNSGRYGYYTGNWFAARSTDMGRNWSYVNPYSDFSNFCCDQITVHDPSRNDFYWYRQGVPYTDGGGNYENVFKLSVDTGWDMSTYCTYTFQPTDVNGNWTNQWWDYPHIQIGADHLYIATNVFDNNNIWTRTVMLRFPLDSLSTCAGFSYNYFDVTDWFTWVPVQGADHVMYFASNWPNSSPQNSRIRIWEWPEDSGTVSWVTRDVAAWNLTGRGDATCGNSSNNWTQRFDQRMMAGTRYIDDDIANGRNLLLWMWNVAEDGTNFQEPYVDAALFYEDDLTQVSGGQGRPYVFSDSFCWAYPALAANKRGDLSLVLSGGSPSDGEPDAYYAINDDFNGSPPNWTVNTLAQSNARPSDSVWGDYNTIRQHLPVGTSWVGATHFIPGSSDCSNCSSPIYAAFGRERDYWTWRRWWWR